MLCVSICVIKAKNKELTGNILQSLKSRTVLYTILYIKLLQSIPPLQRTSTPLHLVNNFVETQKNIISRLFTISIQVLKFEVSFFNLNQAFQNGLRFCCRSFPRSISIRIKNWPSTALSFTQIVPSSI